MNITEFQCDGYTVTSYGSGIAYFIARNEKEGFFVQGDDDAMAWAEARAAAQNVPVRVY